MQNGKLIDFLKIMGMATGMEIVEKVGFVAEELEDLVMRRVVSRHAAGLGQWNYRYPFYEVRSKGGPNQMLELVRMRPWQNATTIRETLGVSQKVFERWEAELLTEGSLERVKKGTAWLYSVSGVEPESKPDLPSSDELHLFVDIADGTFESVQQIARLWDCSREVVSKTLASLIKRGLVKDGKVVGYPSDEKEQEAFLRLHFKGETVRTETVRTEIPPSKNSNGYPQPMKPWADMEELSQAILEEVGEEGMPFRELRRRLSKSTGPGTPYRTWDLSHLEPLGPTLQKMGVVFFDGEDGKFDPGDPTTCWVSLE